MTYWAFAALVNSIFSLLLGVLVFTRNKKSTVNKVFGLVSLSVFLWSICYFLWQIAETKNSALFWLRLLNVCSSFIPITFLHWIFTLTKNSNNNKVKLFLILNYLSALIISLFSFDNIFIKDVQEILSFKYWPIAGYGYKYYLGFYSINIIIGLIFLITKIFKLSGSDKKQLIYVLFGSFIGFSGGATNFPLWYGVKLYPIGNILVSFYVFFLSYAIIAYRLFDIKIILRKSSIYIFAAFIVWLPAFILKGFLDNIQPLDTYAATIYLIIAIAAFNPIKNIFNKFANKYFFTSAYDSKALVSQITTQLQTTLSIEQIGKSLCEPLQKAFHSKSIGFLVFDKFSNAFQVATNYGFQINNSSTFKISGYTNQLIKEKAGTAAFFIKENEQKADDFENKLNTNPSFKLFWDQATAVNVEMTVPLYIGDEVLGLLVFGAKESRDAYNYEDLQTLLLISLQASSALKNALTYDETKDFNDRLKLEVDKATKSLTEANTNLRKFTEELETTNRKLQENKLRLEMAYSELKQLDDSKSQFISMASHQLRTPISIIRGNVSMLFEGDFGTLSTEQREIVNKVQNVAARLNNIVNDILNASRIESNKFEINREPTDIVELVTKAFTEFKQIVPQYLDYSLELNGANKILLNVDPEKIFEVVCNLIDNAFNYTKTGLVKVEIQNLEKSIRISVKDSGIGIPKEKVNDLFKRFTRLENAKQIRPDGSGIGLYLAKIVIESHNGKVWVESDLGKGSTFIIELPK